MEISGQQLSLNGKGNDRSLNMREGEVYRAKIEKRVSDREAVVSVRGQEVKAKFEGKVPDRERVNVEVRGRSGDGIVQMRSIGGGNSRSGGSAGGQTVEQALRNLGHRDTSPELRRTAQRMLDRGVPLTRETVQNMNQYIQSNQGTSAQREQTLNTMANKRIEPTANQIRAVHEALHGQSLSRQISHMTGEAPRSAISHHGKAADNGRLFNQSLQSQPMRESSSQTNTHSALLNDIQNVRAALSDGQGLRQAIEQLQQTAQRSENTSVNQAVNSALREMISAQASSGRKAAVSRMDQLIRQFSDSSSAGNTSLSALKTAVADEPDITRAIEAVQRAATDSNQSESVRQQLNEGVRAAEKSNDQGRELQARQVLTATIQQVMTASTAVPQPLQMEESRVEARQYMQNEFVPASAKSSKSLLITEVTERLAQATDEFKTFQRDTVKQLNRIDTMIRNQPQSTAQPSLESVIKQIDRQIMRSDWMMFTDMKTERKLLGVSSQLADAKKMLKQGNVNDARQTVRQVQQTMEQMNFRPAQQRVQHIVSQEQQWQETKPPVHRLSQQMEQNSRSFMQNEGSGRQIFEGMRGIGLTREAEISQALVQGREMPNEAQQRNIKSILMQLANGEDERGRSSQQQAQQSLQQVNGQQLLNRNDSQQNNMHMFHIPVTVKGEEENLQVYVNGREDGETVDWENCHLYFHIETKNLGSLGISLQAVERSLNVTLKNDTAGFAEHAEPLTEKYMSQLEEIGFEPKNIRVQPMTINEEEQQTAKLTEEPDGDDNSRLQPIPHMTDEGFDFKI
ncbi:hypothetical protein [Salisediminibacterium halotolerans]|uniref:Hook-length control protein FliK n=1 Tax=Salisediminibacterium halotolerans TaxID=517425 RepID=A0A1H9PCV1_9BACI|nr:hypothetical protein [Salisediminibacterium haloalkalitolerans]SER46094.1 hypothetical protein SAMN05444126_101166 [Salisediminibacterium haloalkalitolerans]